MSDILTTSITWIIAFFVSIYNYKKLQPRWLRMFPFVLFLWLSFQVIGHEYYEYTGNSNHFIFNLYLIPEYEFYFFFFYKAFLKPKFKLVVLCQSIFFFVVYCYKIFFQDEFFTFSSFTDNIGQLLILSLCFLYLADLFMAEKFVNYFKLSLFWITTGIMTYCIGNFVYMCFLGYILKNNLDPDGDVYFIILTVVTNIQYGLFAIGFLCFDYEQ